MSAKQPQHHHPLNHNEYNLSIIEMGLTITILLYSKQHWGAMICSPTAVPHATRTTEDMLYNPCPTTNPNPLDTSPAFTFHAENATVLVPTCFSNLEAIDQSLSVSCFHMIRTYTTDRTRIRVLQYHSSSSSSTTAVQQLYNSCTTANTAVQYSTASVAVHVQYRVQRYVLVVQ